MAEPAPEPEATCGFCGSPLPDGGVSPGGGEHYCTPAHAAKADTAGAVAVGESGPAPTDAPTQDAKSENPRNEGVDNAEEPETPDANPGVEAGEPDSSPPPGPDVPQDPDPALEPAIVEIETTPAIVEIDPSSPAVDTSDWPSPEIDGYAVPRSLRERDIWLCWSPEFGKTPMAPWKTGHMFPASWGADVAERPETAYDQAKMVAEMAPETIHDSYAFPPLDDGDDAEPHVPDAVKPTVFMPHDPPDPPIMLVDFDDVRDPENGGITPEAMAIIRRLGSYAEVSSSGTGVHVFVRAALPGALGKLICELDMLGHIEMYDHGRFVGATWDHLAGTPVELARAQDDVDHLVERYETDTQRRRRQRDPRTGAGGSPEAKAASTELDAIRADFDTGDGGSDSDGSSGSGSGSGSGGSSGSSGGGGRKAGSRPDRENAYYHALDVEAVARRGRHGTSYFSYREDSRTWKNGPHPAHGPEHSDISECTNFGIRDDGWCCFAHEDGGRGGALALLAVVEGIVDCDDASRVHNGPAALLKTCLVARDDLGRGRLDDADPPYTALVGVAQQFDLPMKNPEKNVLGESAWEIARKIYAEMEPADVEDA